MTLVRDCVWLCEIVCGCVQPCLPAPSLSTHGLMTGCQHPLRSCQSPSTPCLFFSYAPHPIYSHQWHSWKYVKCMLLSYLKWWILEPKVRYFIQAHGDGPLALTCIEIQVGVGGLVSVTLHMPPQYPPPCTDHYATTVMNQCRHIPLALSYILAWLWWARKNRKDKFF